MSLGPLVHAAKQSRTDANLEGLSSEGRRKTKIMRTIAPIFLLCKPNLTNSQARSKAGIMRLNLDYKMPVIFGVLAVMTEDQVQETSLFFHFQSTGLANAGKLQTDSEPLLTQL